MRRKELGGSHAELQAAESRLNAGVVNVDNAVGTIGVMANREQSIELV